jgi:hypothetical protein
MAACFAGRRVFINCLTKTDGNSAPPDLTFRTLGGTRPAPAVNFVSAARVDGFGILSSGDVCLSNMTLLTLTQMHAWQRPR